MAFALAIGACSQPGPKPPIIRGEPMFDKYGDVTGCVDGVYIPGAALEDQCLPPPDECESPATASAVGIPCPPQRSEREDRDDNRAGDPTGAPNRP